MSSVRRFVRRLGQFIGAGRGERELAREVDAHLQSARAGLPRAAASRRTKRAAPPGGRSATWNPPKSSSATRGPSPGWKTFAATSPTAAARWRGPLASRPSPCITLALGIGAVTVIYSVLRNVVLDPFPYSRSDRMVNVLLKDESGRIIRGPYFPAAEFLDYQEQATAFEDVVGTSRQAMHWTSDAGAER